ncbi:MAG: hypothetical protein KAI53_03965 [Candidatus Aenigmarchaeota archaeon]|nr:hypothetical protein [Candidatus Aenigmarchaeota archaeon]
MVWARTKLTIFDNIFEPQKDILMNFTGPHPERLYNKIQALLKEIFEVPDSKIQEMFYTWETVSGQDKFKVRWRLVKDYDIYSYLRFDVVLSGSSANNSGHASLILKPRFITEYPQDTIIQQSILYEMARRFWHTVFYHRKRMEWFEEARHLSVQYQNGIKQYFEELRHGGS